MRSVFHNLYKTIQSQNNTNVHVEDLKLMRMLEKMAKTKKHKGKHRRIKSNNVSGIANAKKLTRANINSCNASVIFNYNPMS